MLNIVSDINPFNYPLAYPSSDANHKSYLGPFLKSPVNLSDPKSNIQIRI